MNKYRLANGWTKERVMEQVRRRNNGERAASRDAASCLYEAADGNRCAIGCFVPDGHPGLKHLGFVGSLLAEYPSLQPMMPFSDPEALREFQLMHDHSLSANVHESIRAFLDEWVV